MHANPSLQLPGPRREPAGFTIVELLVVVAFIAILAAIAIPRYHVMNGRSHDAKVKSDIRNALHLEEQYYGQEGAYVAFSVESGDQADPPGFAPSPGVAITATVSEDGVVIVGRHPAGSTPWCVSSAGGSIVAGESC